LAEAFGGRKGGIDASSMPESAARTTAKCKDAEISLPEELRPVFRQMVEEYEFFTILAYGGNGPLHACGIANALGINRILAPPFSSTFSACGAGNVNQMHIHEMSTWTVLFNQHAHVLPTTIPATSNWNDAAR
jgi:N-methylhydantoinase A/oxoprolinase/acetone carboxylase beta subunit